MTQASSITITADTIAKARTDIQQLNGQLAELRNEEQRCQLKRTRLEAERARIMAFIDMCELTQRFNADSTPQGRPAFQVVPIDPDKPNGVKFVEVTGNGKCAATPPTPRTKQYRKPENTPMIRDMVTAALQDAARHGQPGLQSHAVVDYVRRKWWPNAKASAICSVAWRMAQNGRLERQGSLYRLNGDQGNGYGGYQPY